MLPSRSTVSRQTPQSDVVGEGGGAGTDSSNSSVAPPPGGDLLPSCRSALSAAATGISTIIPLPPRCNSIDSFAPGGVGDEGEVFARRGVTVSSAPKKKQRRRPSGIGADECAEAGDGEVGKGESLSSPNSNGCGRSISTVGNNEFPSPPLVCKIPSSSACDMFAGRACTAASPSDPSSPFPAIG